MYIYKLVCVWGGWGVEECRIWMAANKMETLTRIKEWDAHKNRGLVEILRFWPVVNFPEIFGTVCSAWNSCWWVKKARSLRGRDQRAIWTHTGVRLDLDENGKTNTKRKEEKTEKRKQSQSGSEPKKRKKNQNILASGIIAKKRRIIDLLVFSTLFQFLWRLNSHGQMHKKHCQILVLLHRVYE